MKVRNLIFKIFTVLALFAFFSCTNLIEDLKKFVVDTQVITADELQLDSINSVVVEDDLIVESALNNNSVVLKSVGYGQTSVVVKGKADGLDETITLTVEVSKEGSIVSWITERIVEGKKIVTENSVKTDSEGTKELTAVETVTDTGTGVVEKTTETVSKTKTDGSSQTVSQIKEGDTTIIVTIILDKDGNGKEKIESVDNEGNKTVVSEKDVKADEDDNQFTETTVEKTLEDLNLPSITSVKEFSVESRDVAEVEIKDGKIKVISKAPGKTKVTVIDAENRPIIFIIIVAADGTVTISPEESGSEGTGGNDSFSENVYELVLEDLNLTVGTSVGVEDNTIVVATVENGKIKLTSKSEGTTKVTVNGGGKKPATFVVAVNANGVITITDLVPAVDKADVDIDVEYGQGEYDDPFVSKSLTVSLENLNLSSTATVSVDSTALADAAIADGNVKITSKAPGTTVVTVRGGSKKIATFKITVNSDGTMTISDIVPAKEDLGVTTDVEYGHNEYDVPFTARTLQKSAEELNLTSAVSVSVGSTDVATAAIEAGNVKVTSKASGTTVVTVSGGPKKTATFKVTVNNDGTMTVTEVIPAKDELAVTVDVNYGHNEYFDPQ